MRLSIDGILSTARRLNKHIQIEEEHKGEKKKEIRPDSVEIRNKINSRLDFIQNELKVIQSSVTKNQIIKDGLSQLIEDMGNGRIWQDRILDETRFENRKVLQEFVSDNISENVLYQRLKKIDNLIEDDVSKLRRLQIEVENILASNLVSSRIEDIISDVESSLLRTDLTSITNISNLRADMVMSLIK